jgi:hypothetical protein
MALLVCRFKGIGAEAKAEFEVTAPRKWQEQDGEWNFKRILKDNTDHLKKRSFRDPKQSH